MHNEYHFFWRLSLHPQMLISWLIMADITRDKFFKHKLKEKILKKIQYIDKLPLLTFCDYSFFITAM